VMYIMSMASLFRLRRIAPDLERPWRAPLYPWFPGLALGLASGALLAMIWFNPGMFALFGGVMAVAVAITLWRLPAIAVPA